MGLLIDLYSLNGLPLWGVHGLVMIVASYAYLIEVEAIVLDGKGSNRTRSCIEHIVV